MFSFFNSFYNAKNKIEIERKQTIKLIINRLLLDFNSFENIYLMAVDEIVEEIVNNISLKSSRQDIEKIIMNSFSKKRDEK